MAKCIKTQPPPAPTPPAEYVLTLTEEELHVLQAVLGGIGGEYNRVCRTTSTIHEEIHRLLPWRDRKVAVSVWEPKITLDKP